MRNSLGPLPRRATVGLLAPAAPWPPGGTPARAGNGRTPVMAHEDAEEPLLRPAVRDGFDALGSRAGQEVRPHGAPVPRGAGGSALRVTHDGDRGRSDDSITFSTGPRGVSALSDPVDPSDDVLKSTISEPGAAPAARVPAYADTLGHDSGVFDLRAGLRRGGDQPPFLLVSQRDAAWAGVLFAAVGTRKQ
ncbi:hypothetical protein [Streptomyces phaeoluteigriseus]